MTLNKNHLYSLLITCQKCGAPILTLSNLSLDIFKKRLKIIRTNGFLETAKCKELKTNSINHFGLVIVIKNHLGTKYNMEDFNDTPNEDTITT